MADPSDPSALGSSFPHHADVVHVWLTFDRPSAGGGYRGIYSSLALAKRTCEERVAEWIASPPWEDDEDPPLLHPVEWPLEPDPGLPAVFHPDVPPDKYVWIGRYCDDEPTWLFKVVREDVVTDVAGPVAGGDEEEGVRGE